MIRREQLSPTWKRVLLRDAVEFLDYLRKPVTKIDRTDGQYPYYGANGQQGTIDDFIFDEPLVLLAEDGGNFGQEGRTVAYKVEGKCWVNNHAHVLRPKNNIDINFLLRHLEYYDVTPYITGTTRGKLTKDAASRIELVLPPLPEQKRIAAILDKADAIRRKRQQAVKLTEELLRSVFLDMFGDPVTNPKGWKEVTIRDLVTEVKYGTSDKASYEGKYPILRMNNITYKGGWDFRDLKRINMPEKELPKYLVCKGDILFNRTNSKALVGKTAVYRQDEPMIYAGYLIRVRPNQQNNSEYIAAYLNLSHGKKILENMCKNIVGMANINAQEFQDIPILQPPSELQNQYAVLVHSVEKAKEKLIASSEVTNSLFTSLLQRAFRGEL
jgi:type I restriction enzyme, S subunit